jgi:hypothetical protein
LAILPAALAEEVDVRDQFARLTGAKRADVCDQPGVADHRLDLAADLSGHGDRGVLVRLHCSDRRRVERDLRARAGDFDDLADRRQRRR